MPEAFLRPQVKPEPVIRTIDPKKASTHVWGVMNKLEGNYANHLELRKLTGEIRKWRFEAVRFTLAPKTTYTPDFEVVMENGSIEFHETKGFWRQTGRVKIKMAAHLFKEFKFLGVEWDKKSGWKFEEFRP